MKSLQSITLGALFTERAGQFADRDAIEYNGCVMTYGELLLRAKAVAKGFLGIGMRHGSHIAIWSTDRPNTLVCFYAALLIGAVAVLPNTSLQKQEIYQLLLSSDVDLLLYGDGYKEVLFPEIVQALPSMPRMNHSCYIGEAGLPDTSDLQALLAAGQSVSDETLTQAMTLVSPADSAVMLFTSGTVGASKGVLTSHYSRANSAIQQADDLCATEQDRFLVAIPMFHCFSLSANILGAMAVGACVCFPEDRHTKSLLNTVQNARCTVLHAVPTLLSALAARPDLSCYNLTSLRIGLVGGAMPSPGQMLHFRERLCYDLLPSLGLTEATAGITVACPTDPLSAKLETVGHFMNYIEGRILNPNTGEECVLDEAGEICVRGYCVMQGYYNLPEMTHQAIDDAGFLHTGDIGILDHDGNIHYVSRKKEIIIRGGENIFPGEIEDCILKDDRVLQVKVIGIPDEHYGEVVCACIAAVPGAEIMPDEIRAHVKNSLAYYKVPKHVLFFDSLPMGDSGKIQLHRLTEMAMTILQANSLS